MPQYELDRTELGSGGYGKVVVARDPSNGEAVAAKIIPKSRMKESAIQKEVELMKNLSHRHIIAHKGAENEGKNYIIYMELATGGELFSRVISSGSLTEAEARPYFVQLMQAVAYMHEQGVVHRDLKLENILLDGNGECKVCDFGLAHLFPRDADGKFDPLAKLREVCGSKSYCAPEVLEGKGYVGFPTDVWSCGICLFAMLAGFFPLDEASGADWRYERVRNAAAQGLSACHTIYGFYERPCLLSKEVTDLIDGMLAIRSEQRLTVAQVLSSPWLASKGAEGGAYGADYISGGTYRGGNGSYSDADVRAMIMEDAERPSGPVYRAIPQMSAPPGAPGLMRQQAWNKHDDI